MQLEQHQQVCQFDSDLHLINSSLNDLSTQLSAIRGQYGESSASAKATSLAFVYFEKTIEVSKCFWLTLSFLFLCLSFLLTSLTHSYSLTFAFFLAFLHSFFLLSFLSLLLSLFSLILNSSVPWTAVILFIVVAARHFLVLCRLWNSIQNVYLLLSAVAAPYPDICEYSWKNAVVRARLFTAHRTWIEDTSDALGCISQPSCGESTSYWS